MLLHKSIIFLLYYLNKSIRKGKTKCSYEVLTTKKLSKENYIEMIMHINSCFKNNFRILDTLISIYSNSILTTASLYLFQIPFLSCEYKLLSYYSLYQNKPFSSLYLPFDMTSNEQKVSSSCSVHTRRESTCIKVQCAKKHNPVIVNKLIRLVLLAI